MELISFARRRVSSICGWSTSRQADTWVGSTSANAVDAVRRRLAALAASSPAIPADTRVSRRPGDRPGAAGRRTAGRSRSADRLFGRRAGHHLADPPKAGEAAPPPRRHRRAAAAGCAAGQVSHRVDAVTAYREVAPAPAWLAAQLAGGLIDAVLFTSPSTVCALDGVEIDPGHRAGRDRPATATAMRQSGDHGGQPTATALVDGLLDAVGLRSDQQLRSASTTFPAPIPPFPVCIPVQPGLRDEPPDRRGAAQPAGPHGGKQTGKSHGLGNVMLALTSQLGRERRPTASSRPSTRAVAVGWPAVKSTVRPDCRHRGGGRPADRAQHGGRVDLDAVPARCTVLGEVNSTASISAAGQFRGQPCRNRRRHGPVGGHRVHAITLGRQRVRQLRRGDVGPRQQHRLAGLRGRPDRGQGVGRPAGRPGRDRPAARRPAAPRRWPGRRRPPWCPPGSPVAGPAAAARPHDGVDRVGRGEPDPAVPAGREVDQPQIELARVGRRQRSRSAPPHTARAPTARSAPNKAADRSAGRGISTRQPDSGSADDCSEMPPPAVAASSRRPEQLRRTARQQFQRQFSPDGRPRRRPARRSSPPTSDAAVDGDHGAASASACRRRRWRSAPTGAMQPASSVASRPRSATAAARVVAAVQCPHRRSVPGGLEVSRPGIRRPARPAPAPAASRRGRTSG